MIYVLFVAPTSIRGVFLTKEIACACRQHAFFSGVEWGSASLLGKASPQVLEETEEEKSKKDDWEFEINIE